MDLSTGAVMGVPGYGAPWLWSCDRSLNGVLDNGAVNRSHNGGP